MILGAGGCVKSQIIKAVTEMFETLEISEQVIRLAFTGTAAYNISGTTIHAATKARKNAMVVSVFTKL